VTAGAFAEFVRRIRLAISDPGAILDRRDNYLEQLLSWPGRAVMRVVYAEQAADVEQARQIAVALEQENARLQQVIGHLLTTCLQRDQLTVPTFDLDAIHGRVKLDDIGNGRTRISYQWAPDAQAGGAS
jgi:hypothetical protein